MIEPLIALARQSSWPEEDVVFWLTSPSKFFVESDRPVDHLHDADAVLAAAKDEFHAEW